MADPNYIDKQEEINRRVKANAIRVLSMDAVEKAKSGHPGMPMGMADIAEVLWSDHLRHNPNNPYWPDRDRFVISNGHGSMLLYSLLHLTGYNLPISEIQNFRQLHSKTPGHPEYDPSLGIETTTGPLGQGVGNAVGMALAERLLSAKFNKKDKCIVDHFTYAFMGDGCMMEGISHEVCSLAGTLGLGKLIVFWDDNGISIDGDVDGWFTDDTQARFSAYGWQIIADVDGHNAGSINSAIEVAKADLDRPSLICCKTVIGWGSPNKQGTESCHGAPLGEEEVCAVRTRLDWPHPPFDIPQNIKDQWDSKSKGDMLEEDWNMLFHDYRSEYPELAGEFLRRIQGGFPSNWTEDANDYIELINQQEPSVATRKASQMALEGLGPKLGELVGGSADLAGSNLTTWSESKGISKDNFDGNYVYFGVREFGMTALSNGLALHGGFIPFSATFLVFSDYARNALRMSALMKIRQIFVLTHDSIGLGEDGPTHQPIEHVASLRLMPNMSVWRPCDAVETAVAWRSAIERQNGPTSLILSRQNVPHQKRTSEQIKAISRGGYILIDSVGRPDIIIIATGSEISLAVEASKKLSDKGRQVRVVSMPSTDVFDSQDSNYRESVLPAELKSRIAIEAGVTDCWLKYVGLDGLALGINTFGESAPAKSVYEAVGLTTENIVAEIELKF